MPQFEYIPRFRGVCMAPCDVLMETPKLRDRLQRGIVQIVGRQRCLVFAMDVEGMDAAICSEAWTCSMV